MDRFGAFQERSEHLTGQHTNRFLTSLSHESRELLLAQCTAVTLPAQTLFYECGKLPLYGWFLTSGLASTVAMTNCDEGNGVESMGNEGVVGSLHLLGPGRIFTRCIMQMQGTALRIAFSDLQEAFWSSTDIRARLLELVQQQTTSLHQSSACHLQHEASKRLASTLLMLQDRTQFELLYLTQETLSRMLGTTRSTVSLIATAFQSMGLILYSRGQVRILDRKGLESAACSCYPIHRDVHRSLYRHDLVPNLPTPQRGR